MRALVAIGLLLVFALDLFHAWDEEPAQLGHPRVEDVAASVPPVNPYAAQVDLGPRFLELVNATRQPRPRRKPVRHALSAAGVFNGHACGGDLPTCRVLACESGGDLTARNPTSSASGKWQILDGTWAGFGGFARAYLAPEPVQDAKARLLWAHGAGARHWRSCL